MTKTKGLTLADLRGAQGRPPPQLPNSLNFMQFSEKFVGKIVCWRPPRGVGAPPGGNPESTTA